jgi:chain length determinant protein EpsF
VNFSRFILIVRARWRVTTAIFGSVILLSLLLTLLMPRQYTATASVVIDTRPDPVAGTANPAQLVEAYLATQLDIAGSEEVARRVVTSLKLDQNTEFRREWQKDTAGSADLVAWLARKLLKKTTVAPTKESNVIAFAVKWPDREMAAALANGFSRAFIDTTIDMKVEPAKEYAEWFDKRSRAVHTKLEASSKRLSDFENKTGITTTDEKLDVENARLSDLSTQLTSMEAERQQSESKAKEIEGSPDTAPDVVGNELIRGLKTQLAESEARLKHVAASSGPNHPDYAAAEGEVSSLRGRIAEETRRIVSSLRDAAQIDLRREREITAALDAQRRRVLDLKGDHDRLAVMQGDVTSAQNELDAVSQRLAQSSLEGLITQTNAIPLTAAVAEWKPSSPKLMLNLALGFVLGAIASISWVMARETTDPRVRSHEDLLRLLSVPVLGTIGAYGSTANRTRPGKVAPTAMASA